MNNLEKLMSENHGLFDGEGPDEGHFSRFEAKLNNYHKKKEKRRILPMFLKVAAVAILVVMSALYIYEISKNNADSNKICSLSDLSNEYKDVEFYYASLTSDKMTQLNDMYMNDSIEKAMVMEELGAMDVTYNKLLEELNAAPNDERVISALIQHYQTKVDILSRIIKQLQVLKPKNTNDHERTEI